MYETANHIKMPLNDQQKPDPLALAKSFSDILANSPSLRKQIITGEKPRPKNWSRKANAPYYKERFALQFKQVLDEMLVDKLDVEYKFSDFPNLSRTSLYLMVNQSKLYLLEQLDPNGQYAAFCQCVVITKEKTGIRISLCRDVRDGGNYRPSKVVPKDCKWRDDMEDFLASDDPEKKIFVMDKLSLNPDEVAELEATLGVLDNIVFNITGDKIKIVKSE